MINEKELKEVNCKYIITVDKRFSLIVYKTDDIENAAKVFAGILND